MATFTTPQFAEDKYNDYMTPKHAWQDIQHLIPKKQIWEAFFGDSTSGDYLKELGFDVIHKDIDFYKNDLGEIIVSNPPFSDAKNILKRLKVLDKPFILLLPCSKLNTQYFRDTFKDLIQIIIPRKRIHFKKLVNGRVPEGWKNSCNFDTFYYCYKMDFKNDITWL